MNNENYLLSYLSIFFFFYRLIKQNQWLRLLFLNFDCLSQGKRMLLHCASPVATCHVALLYGTGPKGTWNRLQTISVSIDRSLHSWGLVTRDQDFDLSFVSETRIEYRVVNVGRRWNFVFGKTIWPDKIMKFNFFRRY